MHSLLTSDASTDKLRQQHQQIQKLHQQLDDQHFETMLAVRQVLTPEQRQQLDKLMQQPPPQLPMPPMPPMPN
jgi:Spy/CpxP family protein refolding chaperone